MKKANFLRIASLVFAIVMLVQLLSVSGVSAAALTEVSKTEISIPKGKEAVYECTVKYAAGEAISVSLGASEIFYISESAMKICQNTVKGTVFEGDYALCVSINPTQKMLIAEVTLPGGGKVTRGAYNMVEGSAVVVNATNADSVSGATVNYVDISESGYKLNNAEPQSTGFAANVYNIVTSFEDASTTRYFAFTAVSEFVGDSTMALRYRRHKGSEWTVVDATKVEEKSEIAKEDYYKVELTGLTPGVEYEYMIGKKESADEENDWSSVYEFITATGSEKSFTFVAVGDSQAQSWRGDTTSNKGYKYMQGALDAAISEAGNPAFILHTGDIVEFGADNRQWNYFFKALGENAATTPFFATMGNHDVRTGNDNNYFSLHFNYPDNGAQAFDKVLVSNVSSDYAKVLAKDYEDTVYSYDYGGVHFIVLNSGTYHDTDDNLFLKAQRKWLENDLKANADARWTVVIIHASAYNRMGGSENRTALNDLYDKYGVDLVIQGHSHLVARTYPMKDGAIVTKQNPDLIEENSGTVYVTIGATTLNHDELGEASIEAMRSLYSIDNQQPTYTVVSVDEDRIVMSIKQLNGLLLDRFVIGKAEPVVEDTPEVTEAIESEDAGEQVADKGCAAAIGTVSLGVISVLTLGAAVLVKRKNDEE